MPQHSSKMLLLLALAFVIVSGDPVAFKSCNGDNTVLTIGITPCNGKIVNGQRMCILCHGTDIKVEAAFLAPFTAMELTIKATALFDGEEVSIPGAGSNPCSNRAPSHCPVLKGRLYNFVYDFKIGTFYRTGLMDVKFEIVNTEGTLLGCAMVPVNIERKPMSNITKN